MSAVSLLSQIRSQALKVLKADPKFARVTCLSTNDGDIAQKIKEGLSKLGILVLIRVPDAVNDAPDAPGPIFSPVTVFCEITELVLANRGASGSKLPADEVAERVAELLHAPNYPGRDAIPLVCERIREIPDKTFVVLRVEFKAAGGYAGPQP
jgi:hypothetical protein